MASRAVTTTSTTPEVELFPNEVPSRRPFSAGDVIRLIVGLVMALGGAAIAQLGQSTIEGIETDLAALFARLPNAFENAVLTLTQVIASVIPLIAMVVLLVRRRFKVAALLVLTAVITYLAMAVVDAIVF